jgi:hypothetical protein
MSSKRRRLLRATTYRTPLQAFAAAVAQLHAVIAPALLVWAGLARDIDLAEAALVAALITLLFAAFAGEGRE